MVASDVGSGCLLKSRLVVVDAAAASAVVVSVMVLEVSVKEVEGCIGCS